MISLRAFFESCTRIPKSILFPPFCSGCRRKILVSQALCPDCWSEIRFLEKPCCEITGIPFPCDMGDGVVSLEALTNRPPFRRLRSAVVYSGFAREMVHALKYKDRTDLAPWMASWMLRAGRELISKADILVPIPLHSSRFRARRFNQSAELARALAGLSKLVFNPDVVERVVNTGPQVRMSIIKRQKNVRSAFRVSRKGEIQISGKNILLIDDVFTTGATVSSASLALYEGGACSVDVLTFARVLPKGHFMNKIAA